ncbi:PSP1 domain-containing protein [Natranaerobius trueperi]|uniref:Stage 0 sporulation protein n=1 Tax=Natranaerobius trueperi TaxID=759412 RepID=A0A226BXK5_9FIRM|nr:stage 0 sporulation family protein [Natranaerobius trueperi]OWZ83641.1 stage 0 sporulation protein [Natranaerobius trueperi]
MSEYRVIGVRFKPAGKIYFFDPNEIDLELEDNVIVETARGLEFGQVVIGPKMVGEEEIVAPLKTVIRKATDEDKQKNKEIKQREEEAFNICLDKISKHGLEMKLVDVEQSFDDSKIIFYFTADGRVDFRDLVKDLAGVFKKRIELRQIGVRDEAKMLGGIGPCGREICCASFLGDFDPVSIKMAKDQNLALNPNKISGICGRLMCCLRYESEVYEKAQEEFPQVGDTVTTEEGQGEVQDFNIIEGTVQIKLDDTNQIQEYQLDTISGIRKGCKKHSCSNHQCFTKEQENDEIDEDLRELED